MLGLSIRGWPKSGGSGSSDVRMSFLKFPFDTVAVDSVEKANRLDDFANRFLGLGGARSRAA